MKRILTGLVLIPLVLLLVFLGTSWMLTLAAALVALLASWEYLTIAEGAGANPPRVAVLVAVALLFGLSFERPDMQATIFGLLSLALFVYCAFRAPHGGPNPSPSPNPEAKPEAKPRPPANVLLNAAVSVFCLFYTGLTLTAIPWLHARENGPSLLIFLMLAVWAGDIAALYVGRAWGRHKLAPRLSPGKTWEGAIGSLFGSLAVTCLLLGIAEEFARHDSARLSYPGPSWYWLLLALLVNAAAQVGDLAESALKRSAGVKDSGTLVPGHGGVLDRIDALLLAAPVLWYALVILEQF